MITMTYLFTPYILSIISFFFSLEPFLFWIIMEFNLLTLVFVCFFFDLWKMMFHEEYILFYFLIQSFFSFIFLFSIYVSDTYKIVSHIMFISSMIGKLGIFPFHFWILKIADSFNFFILLMVLSIQKIPMFIIFFNMSFSEAFTILLFSSIFGSIMVNFTDKLKNVLIFSSISSSFWVLIIYSYSNFFYFIFFFIYTLFIFSLVFSGSAITLESLLFFMFICGLPPFSLFYFKIYISSIIPILSVNSIFLVFWVMSLVSLFGYTKYFYSSFFHLNYPYLKDEFLFKKMFNLTISFFFLIFLMF